MKKIVEIIGAYFSGFFFYVGGIAELSVSTFTSYIKPPYDIHTVTAHMKDFGIKSLPIAMITSVFTGGVLALQLSYSLANFGAKTFVGAVVGVALVRELGPVLTSLLVGGRVGAGITAEIGSMNIAEQIDAMRSLGANPLRKLVGPKVLACMLVFPLLTMLADFLGIIGGMAICALEIKLDFGFYINNVKMAVTFEDAMSGVAKTVFFGFFVSIVACYQGLNTTGGTEGLGKATTSTVVISLIVILISDFFLTKIFLLL